MKNSFDKYADMLYMSHYVSKTRAQMPIKDRAAQFCPFSALTGYEDAIDETARITTSKHILHEDALEALDKKLEKIIELSNIDSEISIEYFLADNTKSGGKYLSVKGNIKRIDTVDRYILLTNGISIAIDDILDIKCDISDI